MPPWIEETEINMPDLLPEILSFRYISSLTPPGNGDEKEGEVEKSKVHLNPKYPKSTRLAI